MRKQSAKQIADGLLSIWKKEISDYNQAVLEKADVLFELDERTLLIKQLQGQYPQIPNQVWAQGLDVIKSEHRKDKPKYYWEILGVSHETIVEGQVAHMIETGEIKNYTFEELASLLRPFNLYTGE